MQIETLKIFCDVVRTASFSRGAAENGVSQSSASHAVSELEKRLGVKLIDRSKRPLVPTRHGRVYFKECRDLVARYFDVENRVRSLDQADAVVGTVRVASIYSVGLYHMSRYVEQFESRFPESEARLEYLHPSRVLEAVRSGDADLGIVSFPRKWPDLIVHPWREESMVLAVHPGHVLAGEATITIRALDGRRIVGFDEGLPIRRAIDRFLRQQRVQVETSPVFDNIENIKRAVEDLPDGMALLPEPTLARERAAASLCVVPFRDANLVRPLVIVHRRHGELPSCASWYLRLLCEGELPEAAKPVPASKPRLAAAAGVEPS